jgi:hypothetical protein
MGAPRPCTFVTRDWATVGKKKSSRVRIGAWARKARNCRKRAVRRSFYVWKSEAFTPSVCRGRKASQSPKCAFECLDGFEPAKYYLAPPAQLCPKGEDVSNAQECHTAYWHLENQFAKDARISKDAVRQTSHPVYPRACSIEMTSEIYRRPRYMNPMWNRNKSGGRKSSDFSWRRDRAGGIARFRSICKAKKNVAATKMTCNLDTDAQYVSFMPRRKPHTYPLPTSFPLCRQYMCPAFEEVADGDRECPGAHHCRPSCACKRTGLTAQSKETCKCTCPKNYVMEATPRATLKCLFNKKTKTPFWQKHRPSCYLKNAVRFPLNWLPAWKRKGSDKVLFQQEFLAADGRSMAYKISKWGVVTFKDGESSMTRQIIPAQDPIKCPDFPCGKFRGANRDETLYIAYTPKTAQLRIKRDTSAADKAAIKAKAAENQVKDAKRVQKHATRKAKDTSIPRHLRIKQLRSARALLVSKYRAAAAAAKEAVLKGVSVAVAEAARKLANAQARFENAKYAGKWFGKKNAARYVKSTGKKVMEAKAALARAKANEKARGEKNEDKIEKLEKTVEFNKKRYKSTWAATPSDNTMYLDAAATASKAATTMFGVAGGDQKVVALMQKINQATLRTQAKKAAVRAKAWAQLKNLRKAIRAARKAVAGKRRAANAKAQVAVNKAKSLVQQRIQQLVNAHVALAGAKKNRGKFAAKTKKAIEALRQARVALAKAEAAAKGAAGASEEMVKCAENIGMLEANLAAAFDLQSLAEDMTSAKGAKSANVAIAKTQTALQGARLTCRKQDLAELQFVKAATKKATKSLKDQLKAADKASDNSRSVRKLANEDYEQLIAELHGANQKVCETVNRRQSCVKSLKSAFKVYHQTYYTSQWVRYKSRVLKTKASKTAFKTAHKKMLKARSKYRAAAKKTRDGVSKKRRAAVKARQAFTKIARTFAAAGVRFPSSKVPAGATLGALDQGGYMSAFDAQAKAQMEVDVAAGRNKDNARAAMTSACAARRTWWSKVLLSSAKARAAKTIKTDPNVGRARDNLKKAQKAAPKLRQKIRALARVVSKARRELPRYRRSVSAYKRWIRMVQHRYTEKRAALFLRWSKKVLAARQLQVSKRVQTAKNGMKKIKALRKKLKNSGKTTRKAAKALLKAKTDAGKAIYGKQQNAFDAQKGKSDAARKAYRNQMKGNNKKTKQAFREQRAIRRRMNAARQMFSKPIRLAGRLRVAVSKSLLKLDNLNLYATWGPKNPRKVARDLKACVSERRKARNAEQRLLTLRRKWKLAKLALGANKYGAFLKGQVDSAKRSARRVQRIANVSWRRSLKARSNRLNALKKAYVTILRARNNAKKSKKNNLVATLTLMFLRARAEYYRAAGSPRHAARQMLSAAKMRLSMAKAAAKHCKKKKCKAAAALNSAVVRAQAAVKAAKAGVKKAPTRAPKSTASIIRKDARKYGRTFSNANGLVKKLSRRFGRNKGLFRANKAAATSFAPTEKVLTGALCNTQTYLKQIQETKTKETKAAAKRAEAKLFVMEGYVQKGEKAVIDQMLKLGAWFDTGKAGAAVRKAEEKLEEAKSPIKQRTAGAALKRDNAKDDLAMAQKSWHIAANVKPIASKAKQAALKRAIKKYRKRSVAAFKAWQRAVRNARRFRRRDIRRARIGLRRARNAAYRKVVKGLRNVPYVRAALRALDAARRTKNRAKVVAAYAKFEQAEMKAILMSFYPTKFDQTRVLKEVDAADKVVQAQKALRAALNNKKLVAHKRVMAINKARENLAVARFQVMTQMVKVAATRRTTSVMLKMVQAKEKKAAKAGAFLKKMKRNQGPFEGVNGPSRGQNKMFYKLNRKTQLSTFKAGWSFNKGFFAAGGQRMSSLAGTGKLITPTFLVTKTTMSFKTGYGSAAIDAMTGRASKAPRSAITLYRDYGLPTQRMLRQHKPAGSRRLYTVMWDLSGLKHERVTLVVSDVEKTSQIYFDEIDLYSEKATCLPECMDIKMNQDCPETLGPTKKNCIRFFNDKGVYQPIQKEAKGGHLYCRTQGTDKKTRTSISISKLTPGTGGGSKIKFGKWAGMKEYNVYGMTLPACVTVRMTGKGQYVMSAGDGRMEFFFSELRRPKSAKQEPGMACVYPTNTPRCADVMGPLRGMDKYKLACDESMGGEAACTTATYDTLCKVGSKTACGVRKTTLDILKCCDKNANKAGSGCTGARRRLIAEDAPRHPNNKNWLYEDHAAPCAEKCRTLGEGAPGQKGKCVAWRLEKSLDGQTHCILSTKCAPAGHKMAKEGKWKVKTWNAYKGTNPYSAAAPKKVRVKKL